MGSYQHAGTQLRINARFVEVETGVVLDTAKATGPVDRVFALQDEVVDKLLGVPPAARPARKIGDKTVKAPSGDPDSAAGRPDAPCRSTARGRVLTWRWT